jgi:hypothetical protein
MLLPDPEPESISRKTAKEIFNPVFNTKLFGRSLRAWRRCEKIIFPIWEECCALLTVS